VCRNSYPCNPESPYSISKLAGELFVRRLRASQSIDATALRLGTAYGEGMRDTAVISRFLDRARNGQPLIIHGSGTQFRQFTHAQDIAGAFSTVITSTGHAPVYNIVADTSVPIVELARLISAHFEVGVEFKEARSGEPPSATITSRLARQELGWVPNVSFEAGIRELIEDRLN